MFIYLTIAIIIFSCIVFYDLSGNRRNKDNWIFFITLILILLSGFSYRLGGDGIHYTEDYKYWGPLSDIGNNFSRGSMRYLPGWIVLSTLCKTVSNSYWFFKLVHAVIVNVAYIKTIKNNFQFVFTGVFLYFILIYFNQNFQVLRESLAIAMFLFALPSFNKNKWISYYFFALLAFSFHDGALIIFVFPFLKLLGINKYSILIYILVLFGVIYFANDIINIMSIADFSDFQNRVDYYMAETDPNYSFSELPNVFLNIVFPVLIIYHYIKRKINITYLYPAVFFVLLYCMSLVIPIFYRFNNYVLIFNYMLVMDFILNWIKLHNTRKALSALSIIFILSFAIFKGRFYFNSYGDTGIPQYVQYYPYSSIVEKSTTLERERLYRIMD